jgi:curved DNA-binding protein CbpA
MSLEQALETLEFKSLEDVDIASLKASFKRLALTEHPDKGGSQFDDVLTAYTFLSGVLRRQIGGRDKAGVLHPEDVRHTREEQFSSEMAILVNEVLDSVQREEQSQFCRVFNAQYEEYKAKEDGKGFSSSESRGYSDWLASDEKSCVSFLPDGEYGPFTMAPPIINEESLHTLFEYTAKCGKPPVTDLMLLPEQMARRISCGGMSLISSVTDSFTSDVLERPEYSDVQEAFTKDNTMVDKIPVFQETGRTFEDLLKERDIEYKTEEDRDLEAIALYEKAYQQQEKEHTRRIQEFFESTGSSQWALPSHVPIKLEH